jgi:hypothetical protein
VTGTSAVDDELLAAVRKLPIDASYIRHVIETLTSIGSSPLGFRNTGTPEDQQVADFVSAEMRGFGLSDVAIEDVEVDAWRFHSARVSLRTDKAELVIEGCSFGGVVGTPRGGVTARLVDVGDPTRKRLDRLDVRNAVVLVDWKRKAARPAVFALELARRGAVGMVLNCPPGGAWFQSDQALGSFDGHWLAGSPPVVFIRKEDATALRQAISGQQSDVTMELDVDIELGAKGHNVVGYLPADLPGPIVVGAHHDAWFQGAFDNTAGVAALLGIAKAMAEMGHRPRHTICFTSRTGEEYGIVDSMHDWCIGAWRQVKDTHPEWGAESPFHLCLEASGHPGLRTIVEAPIELTRWAGKICRAASDEGWTPTGYRVAPPVAGTEQWPYLVSGVPGVAAYAWETSFAATNYHTQLDTLDMIDTDIVAAQARLYALLLMSADQDPDAVLDHKARARQLARIAKTHHHDELARAAEYHVRARGRADFTEVGRGLFALDANTGASLPHDQAAADVEALDSAITALDEGNLTAAARALSKVGNHSLYPYVSEEAFRTFTEQFTPAALARSWGSASHITSSPFLWAELAALRGDDPARPLGPWVRESLIQAHQRTQQTLSQRLDAMARSVTHSRIEGPAE